MAPPARKPEASLEQELRGCDFGDGRLDVRLRKFAARLAARTGSSIPWACEDWASTKAAYRFLANPRIGEAAILEAFCRHARSRSTGCGADPGAARHDRVFVPPARSRSDWNQAQARWAVELGRPAQVLHQLRHRHAFQLGADGGGPTAGPGGDQVLTRNEFKGTNALKRAINPTRVAIEAKESVRWLDNLRQATALLAQPQRCLHIGDRESDIFELFCTAHELGTHFLVRTCVDRLCWDGSETIAQEMAEALVRGFHRVAVSGPNRAERRG